MTYTPIGWTEAVPINVTNLNILDDGIDDAHRLAEQRGGRVLIGYYNRASDSSTENQSIVCDIPVWAQQFAQFELVLNLRADGTATDIDMPQARMYLNTKSTGGNSGGWRRLEDWRASAGTGSSGEGGVFDATFSGDFGVAGRMGVGSSAGRVLVARRATTNSWTSLSDWTGSDGKLAGGTVARIAAGRASGTFSGSSQSLSAVYLWAAGTNVEFHSSSRVAVYGVPRPGLDEGKVGDPVTL